MREAVLTFAWATIDDMVKRVLSAREMGYAQADKRIQILQLVSVHGSISQAIHTLTNLAGEQLVDSSVGGSGGGGAQLTIAGQRLLEAAAELEVARRSVLARFNGRADGPLTGPRTSMRNHLRAQVERMESDGARDPMVRVVLTLAGGGEMASLITRESAELLDLAEGLPVLALCKATAVRVQPLAAGARRAAAQGNQLTGKVLRVSRGVQRDEVVVTLADEMQLVGFADRPNRLRAGSRVQAVLDETAVVLALVG